jgi:hypothetical protein
MTWIRQRLTYANVVATIALFVALGGTSYAALRISGSQLKNRSVSGRKLKRNTLGGVVIKESRLGRVPRARRADTVGGLRASQLLLRCPPGTFPLSGVCFEMSTRSPLVYGIARIQCGNAGRRLPTFEELANLVSGADFAVGPGGELTSDVFVRNGLIRIVTVIDDAGVAGDAPDTPEGQRPYRCVAYPSN